MGSVLKSRGRAVTVVRRDLYPKESTATRFPARDCCDYRTCSRRAGGSVLRSLKTGAKPHSGKFPGIFPSGAGESTPGLCNEMGLHRTDMLHSITPQKWDRVRVRGGEVLEKLRFI